MIDLGNSLRSQIRHPTSTSVDSRNWTENCDHDIMNQQLFLPHYPPSQPQTPHSQHTGHPFQPVHSKCMNQKPPQRQRPRRRVLYLCVEREKPVSPSCQNQKGIPSFLAPDSFSYFDFTLILTLTLTHSQISRSLLRGAFAFTRIQYTVLSIFKFSISLIVRKTL